MTKYVSTRNKKSALYAHEAIIRGLSEDGGLYTPLAMDIHIDPAELLDLTYQQQASRIIGAFFDDYTPAEIEQCTKAPMTKSSTRKKSFRCGNSTAAG